MTRRSSGEVGRLVAGLFVLIGAGAIPGLVAAFIPDARHAMGGALPVTLAAIAFGGAIGAALIAFGREPIWSASLCGALGAVTCTAAVYYYAGWRENPYKIEVLAVTLAAAAPAWFLFRTLRPAR